MLEILSADIMEATEEESLIGAVSRRHTRESGHPVSAADWIPAFAGMTASENH